MDIWDYFRHRDRELVANSVATDEMHFEVAEDHQSGRMWGDITMTDEIYLSVRERVEVQDGTLEVVKRSYYVVANGIEVGGRDKAPDHHDQPIHGHVGPDHQRVEAEEVTLEEALEWAWKEVELHTTTDSGPDR